MKKFFRNEQGFKAVFVYFSKLCAFVDKSS